MTMAMKGRTAIIVCVLCGKTGDKKTPLEKIGELCFDQHPNGEQRIIPVHSACLAKVPEDQRPLSRHPDLEVQVRLEAYPWEVVETITSRSRQ